MSRFTNWATKYSKSAYHDHHPEVRISKDTVLINKFLLRAYWKDFTHTRIGYDQQECELYLMPTHSTDKYGFKLTPVGQSPFMKMQATIVKTYSLIGKGMKGSVSYSDVAWDAVQEYLVVKGVKRFADIPKEARP